MDFWNSIIAIGTWALVIATLWLVCTQSKNSRDELKVRIQRELANQFYGETMIIERKKLADQFLSNAAHEEIQEDVMNFFEEAGMYLRRGFVDKEMMWTDFCYYAIGWWSACKGYILQERKRKGNDNTIFRDFETFVERMYEVETKERGKTRTELTLCQDEIQIFLQEEKNL